MGAPVTLQWSRRAFDACDLAPSRSSPAFTDVEHHALLPREATVPLPREATVLRRPFAVRLWHDGALSESVHS